MADFESLLSETDRSSFDTMRANVRRIRSSTHLLEAEYAGQCDAGAARVGAIEWTCTTKVPIVNLDSHLAWTCRAQRAGFFELCLLRPDPFQYSRGMMESFWTDIRVALRSFRQHPGFALVVMTTLAIAMGANIAVFSVVTAVQLRALPYASPDRLMWLTSIRPDNPDAPFSLPEFMDYRAQTRSLSGLAAYANWSANVSTTITQRLQGARMSANAFDVLGITPAAGRLLRDSDDRPEAPPVAVLSYGLWQRQFGGLHDVVGQSLRINGASFLVVGVLPPQFPMPLRDIDVIVPLVPDNDPNRHARNSVNFLRFLGRLNSGTSATEAQAELTAICRSLRQQFPIEYARKEAVRAVPLQSAIVGDNRPVMFLLLAAVILVFSTAMANLLSMTLVRATDRYSELSIRVALGASRLQLLRQFVVEGFVMALAGSGVGTVLGVWLTAVTVRFAPASVPRLSEVTVDGNVFMFAAGLAATAAALFTLPPMCVLYRLRTRNGFQLSSCGAARARWNYRTRHVLVVTEISTALMLLLASTLVVETVFRLERVQPGFDPDGVFQARVSLPPTYRSSDDLVRFYDRLSERLASEPGVESVGMISIAPMSGLLATVPFTVAGQPLQSDRERTSANLRAITPGYLSSVGTRLIEGRGLQESDTSVSPAVALVSLALADRLPSNVLGQQILIDDNSTGARAVSVVGVVENVRQAALDAPPTLDIYVPLRQIHPDGVPLLRNNQFWIVRTQTPPENFRSTFVAHLRDIDADAAVAGTGTMGQFLDAWLGPRRFTLALFVAFALTAVLLAVSGLYGLVSYTVSRRQREIGVRIALGATERDVHRYILREAARLAISGVVLGMAVSVLVRMHLESVLPGASIDWTLGVISGIALIAVVLLAAWIPARRAARISPTAALKGE